MGILNREQLRTRCVANGRRYRDVPLQDGTVVRVQSLNRAEQRAWRRSTQKKDGSVDPKKIDFSNDLLLAACIVDEQGKTVFTEGDALSGMFDLWDTRDTTLLVDAVVDHCGLIVDSKEVEATLKNSDATPGNDTSGVTVSSSE